MFEVEFYQKDDGQEPIKDFLIELKNKAKTSKIERVRIDKMLTYIRVLERMGTRAGLPYVKHIEGDIWELRPLKDRIFFFFHKDNTYVLLHHFLKKTQKTPKNEIKIAKDRMAKYMKRSADNGK